MRVVIQDDKIRKVELDIDRAPLLFQDALKRFKHIFNINIKTACIAHDRDKNEFSVYGGSLDGFRIELPEYIKKYEDDSAILVSLKFIANTKEIRLKNYYLGNYLGIDGADNVFHTGIYPDTGEYTLLTFADGTTNDIAYRQNSEMFIGRSFTKGGKFIRESRYYNES